MVTAVKLPMVQVRPLQINQQRAPRQRPALQHQRSPPQQKPKALQAVLLILRRQLKAKRTVLLLPDNFVRVLLPLEFRVVGAVSIRK